MLRKGDWKLVHYVGYPNQLFNLRDDPDEVNDPSSEPDCVAVLRDLMSELTKICDPARVDKAARTQQSAMIEINGGREPIIKRGDLGFSMPPVVAPEFD